VIITSTPGDTAVVMGELLDPRGNRRCSTSVDVAWSNGTVYVDRFDQTHRLPTGVNVIITIFGDFLQHLAENGMFVLLLIFVILS
jgi:hypothetical protein